MTPAGRSLSCLPLYHPGFSLCSWRAVVGQGHVLRKAEYRPVPLFILTLLPSLAMVPPPLPKPYFKPTKP